MRGATITIPVRECVSFRPQDIRENFGGTSAYETAVYNLPDADLLKVADYCTNHPDLWEVIDRLIREGLSVELALSEYSVARRVRHGS
jgi:hypothetical protein